MVAIFVSGAMGVMIVGATYVSANRVTILLLDSDAAATHAAHELAALLPFAERKAATSLDTMTDTSERTFGTIVIVGHGTEDGIMVADRPLSWQELGQLLSVGPSHTIMVAACYSDAVRDAIPHKRFLGFASLVDVDEAAFVAAATIYGLRGNLVRAQALFSDLFEIMVEKIVGASSHPLATLGYQTKIIRGIWHVKYNDAYVDHVTYTHPDPYINYRYIGVNSEAVLGTFARNLVSGHMAKWRLDNGQLANIIVTGLGALGIGFLAALTIITAGVALIVGALLFLLGAGIQWFIDDIVRDESGAGWFWMQNLWSSWWGVGFDLKIGQSWWFHYQNILGGSQAWPLWYGGQTLGIDGW